MTTTTADLTARVGALPPMPRAAARVLALLRDPDASAEQMGRVIETDPALTAAVLRLVNSALFSVASPVTSLSRALVLIGFLRLRSLTLATVTAGLRDLVPPAAADSRDCIWEHSVNVALGARAIAGRLGFDWSEEAFIAGLLHDCGRLVLLARMTSEYHRLVSSLQPGTLPHPEEERSTLGLDHTEIGAALLRHWHLPEELAGLIERHHVEDVGADASNPELLAVVMLADRLLKTEPDPALVPPARCLNIAPGDLFKLGLEIPHEVAEARASLLAL
jgi:putative nucleotidyltransferase with HDIG domain